MTTLASSSNPLYHAILAGREQRKGALFLDNQGAALVNEDEFLDLAARLASVLIDAGAEPGDRVAVQVQKSIEALALYVGCVQAGIVFLPLNTAYTARELDYFVGDAEPALLVVDPGDAEQGEALLAARSYRSPAPTLLTLAADGTGSLMERARATKPLATPVARQPDDLAAILYTSGTTGRSKGAMLTQHNLLSNAESLIDAWRFTADDVLLHALPIYHTHGLFVAAQVLLLCGGRMIFQPRFNSDDIIAALPAATSMMGVPTFYTRLLADKRFGRELAGHVRLFTSGSAPLLAETHRQFEALTGQRILERYGMTETNMSTSNPYEGERRAGTVGFALPEVELRIRDTDTGELIDDDRIGVLEVRGPNVFKGYWRMPDKTREEFQDDGFFITGDLVQRDNDGYLSIVGRGKDLIITGGLNVYPKEVETLIDALAGVAESAVFGVTHPDFGEGVVAVVVPEQTCNETENAALIETIRQTLDTELADFKRPKHIEVITELPRNTMGKVQKNQLREQWHDLFSAG